MEEAERRWEETGRRKEGNIKIFLSQKAGYILYFSFIHASKLAYILKSLITIFVFIYVYTIIEVWILLSVSSFTKYLT
jgi:hypothetical protein